MPKIDEDAKAWQMASAERFGHAVASCRRNLGLTAAQLADRTRALGYPIHRVAIGKLETNARAGKVDLGEILVLAAALETSPVSLVFPGPYNEQVETVPGLPTTQLSAAQWFSGLDYWILDRDQFESDTGFETALNRFNEGTWTENLKALNQWRELDRVRKVRDAAVMRALERNEDFGSVIRHYDREIETMYRELGVANDG